MKIRLLFFFILFFSILAIIGSFSSIRCSPLSLKIFDDLLGFTGIESACKKSKNQKVIFKPEKFNNLDLKTEVECPKNSDIILIIGQSNSANNLLSSVDQSIKDINFNYLNNKCYQLSEPVLGATGNKYSFVSSLSAKLINKDPIVFFTAGVNASSIKKWSSDKEISYEINKSLKNLVKDNSLSFIIWVQGESDAFKNIDYISHFKQMRQILLDGIDDSKLIDNKFIITQTSICNSKQDKILTGHQKELGMLFNDVIVTDITDNLDNNYRYDGCHFNKFGTEAITNEISKIINKKFMIE